MSPPPKPAREIYLNADAATLDRNGVYQCPRDEYWEIKKLSPAQVEAEDGGHIINEDRRDDMDGHGGSDMKRFWRRKILKIESSYVCCRAKLGAS